MLKKTIVFVHLKFLFFYFYLVKDIPDIEQQSVIVSRKRAYLLCKRLNYAVPEKLFKASGHIAEGA